MKVTFFPYQYPPLGFHAEELEDYPNRILVQLTPAELRQAEVNSWFFIKPELKGKLSNGSFLLSLPIRIQLAVRPDLIYRFKGLYKEWGGSVEMLKALAWEASQPGATEPDILLRPDSWICLRVEQEHPGGKTGYDTLWMEILPKMEAAGIGPKDLDFTNIDIYFKNTGENEDFDPSNLDIEFGDKGQIFAVWPVEDNPKVTPAVPINEEELPQRDYVDLLSVLSQFLESENIRYRIKSSKSLEFSHKGKNGRWSCEIVVNNEEKALTILSLHPFQVTKDNMSRIEGWITEVNHQLGVGSFSLDKDAGDVRFKTGAHFESHAGFGTRIKKQLDYNVSVFDKYYDNLLNLLDQ